MGAIVSRSVVEAVAALTRAAGQWEVCGLLTGTAGQVTGHVPARNVAEHAMTQFEIDPKTLFAMLKAERNGGLEIVGCYHSHPSGEPAPSRTDAGDAAPDGKLWLILSTHEAGLWRAVADGARFDRFDPVDWAIMTPSGLHDGPGFSKRPGEPHIRSLDA